MLRVTLQFRLARLTRSAELNTRGVAVAKAGGRIGRGGVKEGVERGVGESEWGGAEEGREVEKMHDCCVSAGDGD